MTDRVGHPQGDVEAWDGVDAATRRMKRVLMDGGGGCHSMVCVCFKLVFLKRVFR